MAALTAWPHQACAMIRALPLTIALLAMPAFARPPPGTDMTSAEHKWWECNKQPNGLICCSVSDGHVLGDEDWRMTESDGALSYEIRIEGVWHKVPPRTVINETRRCGVEPDIVSRSAAKVWYSPRRDTNNTITEITIYCFMAGTEY